VGLHDAAGRRCEVQPVGPGAAVLGLAEDDRRSREVDRVRVALKGSEHDVVGSNRGLLVLVAQGGHL